MAYTALSRRERQIMDILYALGSASTAQVQEKIPESVSYSTVRAQLRVLEEKGHVSHTDDGGRYTYRPTVPLAKARRSALRHLTDTFFQGSAWNVVAALVGGDGKRLTPKELDEIAELIERAKRERPPAKEYPQ